MQKILAAKLDADRSTRDLETWGTDDTCSMLMLGLLDGLLPYNEEIRNNV